MLSSKEFKAKVLPHVLVVVGFALITMLFFSPAFFGGKQIKQSDILAHKGASKELVDYRESKGSEALWTNSMFGGMPAYQISTRHDSNLIAALEVPLRWVFPHPFGYMFLAFLCFYGLMLILKVKPWLAAAGALAYGLASYNIQLFEAGHNSKMAAISYMPMVLGGIVLVFQKRLIFGGAVFAFFLSLELNTNHLQMTYYLAIALAFVTLGYLLQEIKRKNYSYVVKSSIILVTGVILSLACNASLLWTTYTYKDQTIRGKSELSAVNAKADATTGLDKSYITQWSYGVGESFSLLVPNFKGGGSGALKENRDAIKKVEKKYRKPISGMDSYFGGQPFTSGPVYLGAVVMLLFIVGMLFYKGILKWTLLIGAILALMLSWGKNFMPLTDFFIENIPLYNNFRAVSMILVVVQLAVPIIGILGLNALLNKEPEPIDRKKIFVAGTNILALLFFFLLLPGIANDYFKPADPLVKNAIGEEERLKVDLAQYKWPAAQIEGMLENLQGARQEVFLEDVKRAILFVGLAWLLLLAFVYKKLNQKYLVFGLLFLTLVDLWSVDRRYLSEDNFVKIKKNAKPFSKSNADKFIELANETKEAGRVLNLGVSTFNDASTSYLHHSIGGYSAVKLRRYQELIEHSLSKEFGKIQSRLSAGDVNGAFSGMHTLNMLNMKYVIYNPDAAPIPNSKAYGKLWMASSVKLAENADEELDLTVRVGKKDVAVISKEEIGNITKESYVIDSLAVLELVSYEPNDIQYEINSSSAALVLFSEIYYKDGWIAYIDGKEVPIARANFILRALEVPQGKHKVRFEFKPNSYYIIGSARL